ncbi:MAG: RHS repeat-associated core domain-containing protein [Angustibacter sp.]
MSHLLGAAPYWTSWTYDGHRRKSQTQHRAAGGDVVDTYSYPAVGAVPDGTTGGFHAASRVDRTGGTPASSTFTYDRSGGTTSTPLPAGGTGTITYDEQGRTRAVTAQGAAAGTTYVYDADGGLLIRRDPNGRKTLYLGDTEVTYSPAQGATPASTSAVRVFTFEGQVVALRTGTGPGGIVFQPPGYQGTALSQGDGAGGRYTIRRFDPFGNTRTPSSDWVGERGFLGGTGATTASTGLVHLGAREYDPATGRFTSVDPVMDLTDPTQWNAYSYAQNSPITLSDPDGNRPLGAGDYGCDNCRQTTTKSKSGKTKAKWKFGNERSGAKSVWGKKYTGYKYRGGKNFREKRVRARGDLDYNKPERSERKTPKAVPPPSPAPKYCETNGAVFGCTGHTILHRSSVVLTGGAMAADFVAVGCAMAAAPSAGSSLLCTGYAANVGTFLGTTAAVLDVADMATGGKPFSWVDLAGDALAPVTAGGSKWLSRVAGWSRLGNSGR